MKSKAPNSKLSSMSNTLLFSFTPQSPTLIVDCCVQQVQNPFFFLQELRFHCMPLLVFLHFLQPFCSLQDSNAMKYSSCYRCCKNVKCKRKDDQGRF